MSEISRNCLSDPEKYTLTRWIDDHQTECSVMTLKEIADAVFNEKGIIATEHNVYGICKGNGFKWRSLRSPRIGESIRRRVPSKQIRFLAQQIWRLQSQVYHLYGKSGFQFPTEFNLDIDGLRSLCKGKTKDLGEEGEE